jgi:hypothetical protein
VNVTLFGYPRTGKTTLFNLLAGAHAAVHAYDDGKREPNVRTLALPDPRLDRIAAAYPEKRKIAAAFDLTDLVGISFAGRTDWSTSSAPLPARRSPMPGAASIPPRISGAWKRSSSWPTSSSSTAGWSGSRRISRR